MTSIQINHYIPSPQLIIRLQSIHHCLKGTANDIITPISKEHFDYLEKCIKMKEYVDESEYSTCLGVIGGSTFYLVKMKMKGVGQS